ncbi:MAG: response regulator, partial [Caldilineaceae bacterium]|nr:response regulator [Caldilineaceae bacterium]
DVMMPGMDGFEVCRRLRADARLAEIPIILVTALDDRSSRLRGIEAGADDFVTKPFDHAELRARVRTITRLNRYRRLLDERERFEWVVDQADDGYVMLGTQNEITYANASARQLLYIAAQTEIPTKKSFGELLDNHFHYEPAEVWERLLSTTTGRRPVVAEDLNAELPLYLIRTETPTSQAQWLRVTLMTQSEGGNVQRLLHLRNVTSQMSTQRDIWTFHSMVMHKLNTPIHTISGGLQLLTPDLVANFSPKELDDVVNLVGSGIMRLNDTISDILQYLRMPVSAYSVDGFELNMLEDLLLQISKSLRMQSPLFVNRLLQSYTLMLSERAMECVLYEVIENAKKFHPQQAPTIEVELTPIEKSGDTQGTEKILLRVTDNGSTLTPEQIEKVFMPYYQAEKYFTGEVPGMGLGLTMVARILWEVGGTCRFSNRGDGNGAVVELVIPVAGT